MTIHEGGDGLTSSRTTSPEGSLTRPSLERFFTDLVEVPEKILAAVDAVAPHLSRGAVENALARESPAVRVGGVAERPVMISPAMWERFVWPHFRRLVTEVVDAGLVALIHLDADWGASSDGSGSSPRGR